MPCCRRLSSGSPGRTVRSPESHGPERQSWVSSCPLALSPAPTSVDRDVDRWTGHEVTLGVSGSISPVLALPGSGIGRGGAGNTPALPPGEATCQHMTWSLLACLQTGEDDSACREGCGRGIAYKAQCRAWRAGNAPSVTPVLYLPGCSPPGGAWARPSLGPGCALSCLCLSFWSPP